jgi:hypothetical protein
MADDSSALARKPAPAEVRGGSGTSVRRETLLQRVWKCDGRPETVVERILGELARGELELIGSFRAYACPRPGSRLAGGGS